MNKTINVYNYSGYGMYMEIQYQDDTMDSLMSTQITDFVDSGNMTKIVIPYKSNNSGSYYAQFTGSVSLDDFSGKEIIASEINNVNNSSASQDMIIYYYPNSNSDQGINYSSYPLSNPVSGLDGYLIKGSKKYPTSCAVNSSLSGTTVMMLLNSNTFYLQPKIDIDSYQDSSNCNELMPTRNTGGSSGGTTTLDDSGDNSKLYFYIIFALVIIVAVMSVIVGFVYYEKFHKK